MIGWPVTCRTDRAAPPRASPSSLVSTTPSKPTPSWNASAVVTASWPIMASTTNRVSSGLTASRMAAACAIISASMPRRPAVSTMTTSCIAARRARSSPGRPPPGRRRRCPAPGRTPRPRPARRAPGAAGRRSGAAGRRRRAAAGAPAWSQQRELAGQRRLTRALQAGEHDHGRRVLGEPQPAGLAAEDRDELLVDDLDDLLGRVERLGHLGAARPLLEPADEGLDDRQRDVGLEQRDPDLARGGVDVGVGEPALAAQLVKTPESRSESVSNTVSVVLTAERGR